MISAKNGDKFVRAIWNAARSDNLARRRPKARENLTIAPLPMTALNDNGAKEHFPWISFRAGNNYSLHIPRFDGSGSEVLDIFWGHSGELGIFLWRGMEVSVLVCVLVGIGDFAIVEIDFCAVWEFELRLSQILEIF